MELTERARLGIVHDHCLVVREVIGTVREWYGHVQGGHSMAT